VLPPFDSIMLPYVWRLVTACVLIWLAIRFGRTLRTGAVPLIQQIAHVANPDLSPVLCRYTRRLTIIWSAYFIVALMFLFIGELSQVLKGVSIGFCSVLLYVGEYLLRPYIFPQEKFPSLYQQIHDTRSVWRQSTLNETSSTGRNR